MILTAIRQRGKKQMRGISSASVIILGQQLADRSPLGWGTSAVRSFSKNLDSRIYTA